MSKATARIRRSKKLRATLQKVELMRISISRKVLATASTQQKSLKSKNGGNIEAATKVGSEIAKKAIELGHKKVTFDRSGYKYHGRVKALADGAREGGLEF